VTVPGNCDRKTARERLAALGLSADGSLVERGGVMTAGVGGGALRTGLTPYERGEEELAAALRGAIGPRGSLPRDGMPLVALSHQPPRDSGADERRGSTVGSIALRRILDSVQPALWVCGHIHESPSVRRIGASLVVNPGPAKDGRYAKARLERDRSGAWTASAELFVRGSSAR
jgi:Icc-related predicted phosphoesterase